MVLEKDKFYKTKNGHKVYISHIDNEFAYGIIRGQKKRMIWSLDGKIDRTSIYTSEIIREWEN